MTNTPKTTNELRQAFIQFFEGKGHQAVPSAPLIPANDPTLLFTNAGMVQFKDTFLGRETRDYTRAVTAQRCIRASGKHNDLENVGYTARHHTFFEMLGNFSFGDYFKREAIQYAWEFLTRTLNIPPEKLWVTVYEKDQEAENIWLEKMKIDPARFSRCSEKDNFWAMGDTGPCGPCSEIFYDHGPEVAGGPPSSPDEVGDRYVEIWNLVFMEFNRDIEGNLNPLSKKSVDTGMGLERIAAVMQNVHSNYDIDIFQHLIKAAATIANVKDLNNPSLRVIADHIRACAFSIADGIVPSNEGRGYVLRRIMRRAIRHGNKLGLEEPFLYKLVDALIEMMCEAYPLLKKSRDLINRVLLQEEEQFAKTLTQGLKILTENLSQLKTKTIPGEIVFKLYDTYGFPADLTETIAKEQGFEIDQVGFDRKMEHQRCQSQSASQFQMISDGKIPIQQKTVFTGYETCQQSATVTALFQENHLTDTLNQNTCGIVVLNETPFYAESGGQAGDKGSLTWKNGEFIVEDTQKMDGAILHIGFLAAGSLSINDTVDATINIEMRQATRLNHSATHLLHAALRKILGDHVMQKGSYVDAERLRFDFSHFEPIKPSELFAIEKMVNEKIRENILIQTETISPKEAKAKGAVALFGEKYGKVVRVLTMGDFSAELCGGTHAERTGDIGLFKILHETNIAAGIRRIEALTGENAIQFIQTQASTLHQIRHLLKTETASIIDRLQQTLDHQRQLEKTIEQLQTCAMKNISKELLSQVKQINEINLLTAKIDNADLKCLRDLLDQLKNKLSRAVIVLASVKDQTGVNLIAGVTKDIIDRFHAGEIVADVAKQIGGKGGGRPDMAQGGGNQIENLDQALASVEKHL